MDNYVFDEKEENVEELLYEHDSSSEEGFMKGYLKEEEVKECSECGTAIKGDKKVTLDIEGEEFVFCSKNCAEEFEESLS